MVKLSAKISDKQLDVMIKKIKKQCIKQKKMNEQLEKEIEELMGIGKGMADCLKEF